MSAIVVHPTDPQADAPSLSQALGAAHAGDTILVCPGIYSPTRTGEKLPLKIPAGVTVIGAGPEQCAIDGEGQFEPSFNPIQTDLSVVVLGDEACVSEVTVTNGGGHGIAVPPGASVVINNCTISQHGDHGVFLCGVSEAVVTNCDFLRNGSKRFEPVLPRGTGARQGHHIFAEARHGQKNRLVLTDNRMRDCFADGVAFICFFPEPAAVSFRATILRNLIEESERGGLLFLGSFGPSQNRLHVVATDNILRGNKQFGMSVITAVPLADRVPQDVVVAALVSGNAISDSPIGILAQGAVGEAHHNRCHLTIDRNQIVNCGKNAVRLIGAIGAEGASTVANSLHAVVSRNKGTGSIPVAIVQGAGGVARGELQSNSVQVRLLANDFDVPPEQAFVVSDGLPGNQATVLAGSHAFTRRDGNLLS